MSNGIDYLKAIEGLLMQAQGDDKAAEVCALVLLSCDRGERFQISLSDLNVLDSTLIAHAMVAITLRYRTYSLQALLRNGGDRLDALAEQWANLAVVKQEVA